MVIGSLPSRSNSPMLTGLGCLLQSVVQSATVVAPLYQSSPSQMVSPPSIGVQVTIFIFQTKKSPMTEGVARRIGRRKLEVKCIFKVELVEDVD